MTRDRLPAIPTLTDSYALPTEEAPLPARVHDLLIIGQGAAGLSAALYAARYRLNVIVVGEQLGGETALAGTVENYPGVPEADGFELMQQFRRQVEALGVSILDERVSALRAEESGWSASLGDGSELRARAVIFAHGRRRRQLGLSHEREWTGRGVSYCSTCDAPLHRGGVVAVVGGGSAAVEGALLNARYARQVDLLYRGDALARPEPVLIEALRAAPNITVRLGTLVTELLGDESGLTGVRIKEPGGHESQLALSGLFVEIGADPQGELPASVGVALNPDTSEVHVDRRMRTNIAGLFAAGDVTDGSGPVKQTVVAAAQGAIAAFSAYEYLGRKRPE